ncbi:MATE family efflux transporter [Shewanella sp. SNU WT4]|uniref:MATE family efflux transporter n=1 Tax=Shewanella sp. SNU WT4 TaxID=2590015 RepID=UPI00112AF9FC|nr:MATE family efflux transporter [Shewanella sp. SNU WT4]QDF68402.1 MATE family efflux transporter [Shewanella sp. SNU WT4]
MTSPAILLNAQANRHLLALALPMILSNITVPLLGLVDTAVIGHLSNAYYLGGVALASTIITLIFWLLGFLRMATTGLVAQAYGRQDNQQQFSLLLQAVSLALIFGLLIIALQQPILELALGFSAASEQVIIYCQQYFYIRIWAAPFALLNLVLLGYLLGRQQPKAAMWQLIVANSANIILDLVLVLGFDMGVKGAAIASVIAEIAGTTVAATMVIRQLKLQSGFALKEQLCRLQLNGYQQLLSLNANIFIRSLCLQAVFAFMTFKAASLGDTVLAANAILLNLLLLISYALDGIAYYAEAEGGRHFGRGDKAGLKYSVALAFYWSAIIAICFSLSFYLLGAPLISSLTSITSVQASAIHYLPWLVLMPILAFGSYLFDGVYIGTAQGATMRNSMIFCTFAVFFPVWWCLESSGNHALWAAMSAFMLTRSLTLGLHYQLKLSRHD